MVSSEPLNRSTEVIAVVVVAEAAASISIGHCRYPSSDPPQIFAELRRCSPLPPVTSLIELMFVTREASISACTCPRDDFCRSTIAPFPSWPTTLDESYQYLCRSGNRSPALLRHRRAPRLWRTLPASNTGGAGARPDHPISGDPGTGSPEPLNEMIARFPRLPPLDLHHLRHSHGRVAREE